MLDSSNVYPDILRKDNTHGRYLSLLSTFSNEEGISLRSNKQEVLDHLEALIIAKLAETGNSKLKMKEVQILHYLDPAEVAYKLGSFLNFALTNSISLTKTSALLGRTVLGGCEPVKQSQRDRSITRVKVGIELLDLLRMDKKVVFRREAMTEVTTPLAELVIEEKRVNRNPYKIKIVDEAFAFKLGLAFFFPSKDRPIFTQPLMEMPWKWKSFHHPIMGEMVRNTVEGTEDHFTPEKAPSIYNFMNTIRTTSFQVNVKLLKHLIQCKNDSLFTHEKKKFTPVQLASIISQQEEIFKIAESLEETEFWLGAFLDFRGRFYYSNTYFHPQGNKLARSLYKFSGEGIPIGKKGWKALLAAAASENGQDKKTFKEKVKYALKHLKVWMECAADPLACKDTWQTAENPCGFLSIILEIHAAFTSENKFKYCSTLPLFIDASNSGTQILSALGKDPIGGRESNLTPSSKRGDVYLLIADQVWVGYQYTEQEEKLFNQINDKILTFQDAMDLAYEEKRWDDRVALGKDYGEFYEANKEAIKASAMVFWAKLKELRRKVCKRPVMTIPYSAGERTISRTLFKDWSPEPELRGLTSTYTFELALAVCKTYSTSLKIPTDMMKLFIKLGTRAYGKKKDLSFKVPHSDFFFVQNARKDKMEKVELDRRGQRLKLNVCVGYSEKIDYDNVKSASAANTTHALDASLLVMIVMAAYNRKKPYPMIVVHDSFATYPGAYHKLYKNCRKQFVKCFGDGALETLILKVF